MSFSLKKSLTSQQWLMIAQMAKHKPKLEKNHIIVQHSIITETVFAFLCISYIDVIKKVTMSDRKDKKDQNCSVYCL